MLTTFAPFNNPVLLHSHDALTIDITHPDACPLCSAGITPNIMHACYYQREELTRTAFQYGVCTYFCPRCKNSYIGIFVFDPAATLQSAKLLSIAPKAFIGATFSAHISALSPDFIRIYHQAEEAESRGLSDLCGLGYRKALEHLVKDYLGHLHPERIDVIRKTKLGDCISMLEDSVLRDLAATASWLGNDFAHYERRHTQLDIDDLKHFILSTCYWISHSLTAAEASRLRNRPSQDR